MTFPTFSAGEVLRAEDMNAVSSWLVKSQTIGAGVSSVVVTGAFSADYDQYVITLAGGTASTSNLISLRLGSTATGYFEGRPGVAIVGGAFIGNVTNGGAEFFVGQFTTTGKAMHTLLMNPFLATETRHFSQGYQQATTAVAYSAGILNDTTSYTSFTLAPLAGTWTGGTINVYGYKK
jgi:hypothetical protein